MREILRQLNTALTLFLLDILQGCDHWASARKARSQRNRQDVHLRIVH